MYDSGDYHATLDKGARRYRLHGAAQRTSGEARARRADGHRHLDLHRNRRRGPGKALRHPGHQDVRQRRDPDPSDRLGHRARRNAASQGQGHETTWAQIVAEELGLDPQNLLVEEGDTDTAPYGLGTYASRSTPVAGAALAMAARRIREKAKKIAAHVMEASEDDVEWKDYKFKSKASPASR